MGRTLRSMGLVALLILSACGSSPPVDAQGRVLEPLTIVTTSGRHDFKVEIADEEAERQQGLMYREPLPADRGMLFQWPGEPAREQAFWMRNTPSSLDILYLAPDGRIISIAPHATPMSESLIPSNGRANGVLELRAGRTEEIGARVGDRIEHPYFKQ